MTRICVVGLLAVLCFLAGFSLLTENGLAGQARRAQRATRMSELYADARFWVGQEESLERKYRLEPGPLVRSRYGAAGRNLSADLRRITVIDRSSPMQRLIARLLQWQRLYSAATNRMFAAVQRHNLPLVIRYDHTGVDPIFRAIVGVVYTRSAASARQAVDNSTRLRRQTVSARTAIAVAFAAGLVLLGFFSLILLRLRGRVSNAHRAEVKRLSTAALVDSLTGLRNHRAFQEDLARELARHGAASSPVSLVMLDLNGLKALNDADGHQAGDERLQRLAEALGASCRATDEAYRVGGDEFALILPHTRAWDAVETIERLNVTLSGPNIGVTAGIAQATEGGQVDGIVGQADLALIVGKRLRQQITLYSPELEPTVLSTGDARDVDHLKSLCGALALAVDAKDSYTRSHCQTVSQLSALIATELRLEAPQIAQMRLAGLLHDVGKIGIPDAILSRPAALTDDEYEQMKRHSVLGEEIVEAAGLPEEARWVRHHHERYDGGGYPDGLAGERIPFQSRIILAADAFEAMTSDRPYRAAPGREYAVSELRRQSGTQFDPLVVKALCHALDAWTPAPPNLRADSDSSAARARRLVSA